MLFQKIHTFRYAYRSMWSEMAWCLGFAIKHFGRDKCTNKKKKKYKCNVAKSSLNLLNLADGYMRTYSILRECVSVRVSVCVTAELASSGSPFRRQTVTTPAMTTVSVFTCISFFLPQGFLTFLEFKWRML